MSDRHLASSSGVAFLVLGIGLWMFSPELRASDQAASENKELSVDLQTIKEDPGAGASQQIVVITDPQFVPISQYFVTELNELPPSSAGHEEQQSNKP